MPSINKTLIIKGSIVWGKRKEKGREECVAWIYILIYSYFYYRYRVFVVIISMIMLNLKETN